MEDIGIPVLAIALTFAAFCVYLDYKVKAIKAGSRSGDNELSKANDELRARTRELEERIQVLESIVTDRKFRLNEEIETL
jgi:hypothetical protein